MYIPYEMGPIRPPSEAGSLLIRVTRNCPWNKCLFCPVYKGARFERRPLGEIWADIDRAAAFHGDIFQAAFLQDANSLAMKTPELAKVISHLKQKFPSVRRVTSYARARSVARKSGEELKRLHEAGLTRLHIGLESGYDPLLEYMNKGATSDLLAEAGRKVKESGISLCFYVILGLGGKLRLEGEETWRNHALETAHVLNRVNPDYIRLRTLTIKEGMPLYDRERSGEFQRLSDDQVVREEELLIENLEVTSCLASDHATNVLMEVLGQLPEEKERLLTIIRKYLGLSPEEQFDFRLGSLLRLLGHASGYRTLAEFFLPAKRKEVKAIMKQLENEEPGQAQRLIEELNRTLI